MTDYTIYGIRNCDTMKKAMRWLTDRGVEFELHDYKKAGIDEAKIVAWLEQVGPEVLVNRRGTTWRRLSEADKQACDSGDHSRIAAVLAANTSVIKRPVMPAGEHLLVGFRADDWAAVL